MAIVNSRAAIEPKTGKAAIFVNETIHSLIRKLFANNEQGFTRTPDDLSTMFQDAAGTVTGAGQAVGLVLDKSKGLVLGTEFLTNNWNLSGLPDWTYSNGVVSKVGTSAGGGPSQMATSPFVAGKLYRIEYEVISISAGLVAIQFSGGTSKNTSYRGSIGKYVEYVFADVGNNYLRVIANTNTVTCSVKIISVKEIKGNHAYQTTSASRPTLQQSPIFGNELVVNGNFSNGTTGWFSGQQASLSVTNGVLRVTNDAVTPSYGYAWTSFPTTAGKKYYVTARRIAGSVNKATNIHIGTGSASNLMSSILANGDANKPLLFTATTITTYIGLNAQDNALSGWMEYDDISVKELLGYRTDQNYIEYDKVDDKLITNLPTQLTNCTVIRSVPGVGVQLLTNQTIPATYEDNKDHCGLIVINRALTPSETSQITKLFNKAAGV